MGNESKMHDIRGYRQWQKDQEEKKNEIPIGDKEVIKFYRSSGDYGFLSNLYKHPIKFEGREFPTSEHAYQFGKFKDPKVKEWAMLAPKPHLLAILAHGLFWWDITENWKEIKVERMLKVLRVKFSNPDLKQKLQDTKDAILIEDSKIDTFWGIGKKGKGKNMLGELLMQVRNEIKNPLKGG